MIRARQLELKDAVAATNLWATAMKSSNYDESMQKRINEFVETKLNDPDDMKDVFVNYVKNGEKSNNITNKSIKDGINFEIYHNTKNIDLVPLRNFWVVEYIYDSQHQDNKGKIIADT